MFDLIVFFLQPGVPIIALRKATVTVIADESKKDEVETVEDPKHDMADMALNEVFERDDCASDFDSVPGEQVLELPKGGVTNS